MVLLSTSFFPEVGNFMDLLLKVQNLTILDTREMLYLNDGLE